MNYDYVCYFDGACEPVNPGGNMGIGAVIFDNQNNSVATLSHYCKAKPGNSNNVAEYQAFGWTVKQLLGFAHAGVKVLIHGDSKLVIEQMNGRWAIKKGAYVPHAKRALEVLNALKKQCQVEIKWIPREQNEKADELSKACMIKNKCEFRIQPNQ